MEFNGANASLTLVPFEESAVAPPCTLNIRYTIDFRAEHAFCRAGEDCGEIMRRAEGFVAARQAGKNPETVAIPVPEEMAGKLRNGYDRMQQIDGQTENLNVVPTFRKFAQATGADQFGDDEILFPFRLGSSESYLGRLGQGHRNYETVASYIFAAYGLNGAFGVSGDRTIPVAGVSIEPYLTGVQSIEVK